MQDFVLELDGTWEFKQFPQNARNISDLESSPWSRTTDPSSIFKALIETDQINENQLYANPENFHHISQVPWIFKKTFDVPAEIFDRETIELIFEGLDTIATIWLNEKLIARTDNMFIQFNFDVKKLLNQKNNCLMIKFDSPIQHAANSMKKYPSPKNTFYPNPHRTFIRKAQYQFGWDFSPQLPGCGIWRPVKLQAGAKTRITDLYFRTISCDRDIAEVKINVQINRSGKENTTCLLSLSSDHNTVQQELIFDKTHLSQAAVIRIENPLLWWPAGYGKQNLYTLDAKLISENRTIHQQTRKVGIRKIKLIRSTDPCDNFCFEVNSRKIYAKGANFTPLSIFPGSASTQDYQKTLKAVHNANINFLRIWGGGFYENKIFYQLCDQLGILIWQDFMFACAYYPDEKWFLDNIRNEAAQIIKRIRNHPSIAIWCGNNEIDHLHKTAKLAKTGKFYGRKIFHQLLPRLIDELDPATPYIPSTPLIEEKRSTAGLVFTTHNWNIWNGSQPVRNFIEQPENIPAFVTEFGLQSLPNLQTIKNLFLDETPKIASRKIEKLNYQLDANQKIYQYLSELFPPPKDIEQLIYLSQVTQARAADAYVRYLRAHKGINNGVMFWQLNQPAPAVSWAAIDNDRTPKALMYYAKNFYKPVIVTAADPFVQYQPANNEQPGSIDIVAVNDSAEPLTAQLNCELCDLNGNTIDRINTLISVAPFSNSSPLKLPKNLATPISPENSCLVITINKDNRSIEQKILLYLPDKYINWTTPNVSTNLEKTSDNGYRLSVISETLIKDLQVSPIENVIFSKNFIDLLPNQEKTIEIQLQENAPNLASMIKMTSVNHILAD